MKSSIIGLFALLSLAACTSALTGCTNVNIATPRTTEELDKADAAQFETDNTEGESDAGMPIPDAGSHQDAAKATPDASPSIDGASDSQAPVPANCASDCNECQIAYKYCTDTACEDSWRKCVAPINTGACKNAGFTCAK